MTLGKLTLFCWVWFGLMSFGFLPLCLLASTVPGPGFVRIALYVFIVGVLWWGSFGYGMYLAQAGMGNGDRRVLKHGIRGTAVVLEAKGTSTYLGAQPDFGNFGRRVYRYKLRVELPDRRPYETYCSVASHGLSEGQQVEVAAARHNRKRVAIDLGQGGKKGYVASEAPQSRPQRNRDLYAKKEPHVTTMHPQPARQAKPSPPRDTVPQQRPHGDESERLRQLAELGRLHKEGVLSDEEFATEKARILGFSS